MPDIVDGATRSRMMSGIRGKNTKPELAIRKAIHRLGFRYRLHGKSVPGKPDMVLSRYKAVIFVNGCFWHGHDCKFFRLPATRPEFWADKIAKNRKRDAVVRADLEKAGWRHLTVWECAVRGKPPSALIDVAASASKWLRSGSQRSEIRGR